MKQLKYIAGIVLLAGLVGCQDDLRDLNTNPEILEVTQPEYLFASATQNFTNSARHHLTQRYSGVMTYMQYLVPSSGAGEGTYVTRTDVKGGSPGLDFLWEDYFTWRGRDLRAIMDLIDKHEFKDKYQALRAVAQILEIRQAWYCMDLYGAMPYTEGLKAMQGGTYTPKYDFSWDMYKKFDEVIAEQVDILTQLTASSQTDFKSYDFFYGKNNDYLDKWAKFGNSLRIQMALRYESRDPEFLKSVLESVGKNVKGVMTSNEDGCWYHHPSDFNNIISDIDAIATTYETTEAFVNTLKGMQDPRLPIMVRKNYYQQGIAVYDEMTKYAPDSLSKMNPDNERYIGRPANPYATSANGRVEYGKRVRSYVEATWKVGETNVTKSVRLISQLQGRYFVKNGGFSADADPLSETKPSESIKMNTCVLAYADFCFLMAEITEKQGKSYFGKDAATWYMDGVKASIDMYQSMAVEVFVPQKDIDESKAMVDAFLAGDAIQYTGTQQEKLEKIYTQSWINNLKHPEEAWANWKRTGYPKSKSWQPGERVKIGYLDELQNSQKQTVLLVPRREAVPQRDENYMNWKAAVDGQIAKDAAYGVSELDRKGRIWWDNKGE